MSSSRGDVQSDPAVSIGSAFAAYRQAPRRCASADAFLGAPIVIYGAGNAGRDVRRLLTERGSSVIGFLDRQAQKGSSIDGLPVWSPDGDALWPSESIAIIAIFNPGVDIEPIRQKLERSGFANVYTFLDLHSAFADVLGDRYWLTHRDRYLDWEADVALEADGWADEESRHIYASLLRFRLSHDYADLPTRSTGAQYFPEIQGRSQRPPRFIDCGAFDGDTLRELSRLGGAEAVAAFEPDLSNYRKLAETCRSLQNLGEVTLFPCALAARAGQARFEANGLAGSSLSDQGGDVVTCVALDEALATFRPTVVKMDIEGAEIEALEGARRMVQEYRPELVLCVYHRPAHLWQIPHLVRSWYGDAARYYLRVHAHSGFDTVFYAIPR
jgi:FkbM family methyltransferase